ncbi:MAG: YfiR family protein [Chitinophagales bacterium]
MFSIKHIAFLLILVFGVYSQQTSAQSAVGGYIDHEYKLKAAYIYNFIKYVEWAEEPADTFYIGILGQSELTKLLSQVAAVRKAKGKTIVVHQYRRIKDFIREDIAAPAINNCNILFISEAITPYITNKKLEQLAAENILLIGEKEGFAKNGGLINFINLRNRLRFEINQSTLINCNFTISPKLLKLAILVNEEDQ